MVARTRFVPSLIFSLGLFDRFTLPEQDPNARIGHFLSYTDGLGARFICSVASKAKRPFQQTKREPHKR